MRILVIDDEAELRRAVSRILTVAGHDVVEAADGRAGLDVFLVQAFDLVLIDIIMPEKEGLETIAAMRRTDRPARIVAMSGGGRGAKVDILRYAVSFGADAAIAKPFRRDDLLAVIEGR